MLIANVAELFLNNSEDALFFRQDVAQISDRVDQLFVFSIDLLPLEASELIQAQIKDLIGLMFAKGITTIDQTGFVTNQDADLFDLALGKFKGKQFDARFISIS